jgi:hypothetical protein
MLVGSLRLGVHDTFYVNLLNGVRVEICDGQALYHLQGFQLIGKVWSTQQHIKDNVYTKERWKIQFKRILTQNFGDDIRPIS